MRFFVLIFISCFFPLNLRSAECADWELGTQERTVSPSDGTVPAAVGQCSKLAIPSKSDWTAKQCLHHVRLDLPEQGPSATGVCEPLLNFIYLLFLLFFFSLRLTPENSSVQWRASGKRNEALVCRHKGSSNFPGSTEQNLELWPILSMRSHCASVMGLW